MDSGREGEFPKWRTEEPERSLDDWFRWLSGKSQKQIQWYEDRRRPQKWKSQSIRWVALTLAGAGALCPLLAPLDILQDLPLAELGYILLALGGMALTFDRMYGFSSSWLRYARTQLNLEIAQQEFLLDWALLQTRKASPTEAVKLMKSFSSRFTGIQKQETDAWITEFRNNLSEIEEKLKTSREERKPGGIKLKVHNARDFSKVDVLLNNEPRKEMEGISETLIDLVPPGHHELLLIGTDATGREHRETRVAAVAADTTTAIDIHIPQAGA